METQVAKIQQCVYLRNDIEVWVDEEKGENIKQDLEKGAVGDFIRVEGRLINTKDIVIVCPAEDLTDLKNKKQGKWKCEYNTWHNRSDNCDCGRFTKEEREKMRM